jgi:exosortase
MRFERLPARTVVLAAYTLCLAVVNLPTLRQLVATAQSDSSASHVIAVPLVSLALVVLDRRHVFSTVTTAKIAGLAVMLCGAGLSLAGFARDGSDALALQVAGLVVCWIAGYVLIYGVPAARKAAFALAFLLFTIPPPPMVLDATTQVLKAGSSATVAGLFSLVGTPYHREGHVFALPGVTIEIADECSGIRSSTALVLTSLLAGHLFLRRGWARAVLLMAVLPVALLKNGIRIVSLSLLSLHVDPSFLTGQLHHEGGIVFFLLALGLMMPLLFLLRRSEERSAAVPGVHVTRV